MNSGKQEVSINAQIQKKIHNQNLCVDLNKNSIEQLPIVIELVNNFSVDGLYLC